MSVPHIGYRGRHRKSRAHGWRLALAPWLVISLVAGVIVSGAALGYAWLLKSTCRGEPTTVTVTAGPDQYTVLDELGQRWRQSQPSINGSCAAVKVVQAEAPDVANALDTAWQHSSIERPDVWVPDASTWVRLAEQRPEANAILPDDDAPLASLAVSATVLAIPEPMAKALEYSSEESLVQIAADQAHTPHWEQHGHAEWGEFRIGMTDPRAATSGLHTLLALADGADLQQRDNAENLEAALAIGAQTAIYQRAPDGFLRQLSEITEPTQLRDIPLFPALERDVAMYNFTNPSIPLRAIYPAEQPAAADYPYVVLNAEWVSQEKREVAAAFLDYLGGLDARSVFRTAGFRTPQGELDGAQGLSAKDGFVATLKRKGESRLPGKESARVLAAWSDQHGATAEASILATN